MSSPNPGSSNDFLNAVAVVSVSDVWAVGSQESGTSSGQTLIEQWNGTAWSVVASPNAAVGASNLNAVAAVSASNVWAVGN